MNSEKVKEIKKALENCNLDKDCNGCPYYEEQDCIKTKNDDILTLINELEKEVETRKAEVLHLQEYGKKLIRETELKQFAERLKEKLKEKVDADNVDAFVECARLSDETLKECLCEKHQ